MRDVHDVDIWDRWLCGLAKICKSVTKKNTFYRLFYLFTIFAQFLKAQILREGRFETPNMTRTGKAGSQQ